MVPPSPRWGPEPGEGLQPCCAERCTACRVVVSCCISAARRPWVVIHTIVVPRGAGVCQIGPILRWFNRFAGVLLQFGPVGILPQLQVSLLALIWLV